LADVRLRQNDWRNAASMFAESLNLARESEDNECMTLDIAGLGRVALAMHQPARAAKLFGATDALLKASQITMVKVDHSEYTRDLAATRAQLTPAVFDAAWNAGRALTLEQAIAEAMQVSVQPATQEAKSVAEPPQYPGGLTQREVEVLRLIAMGLSNQEIADKLVLSKRTVHAHLRSIFAKLDVTTRTAATRVAMEHKIV
jgi:ATP/maltotriose-dependent transcriptional regulator MalT